MIINGVLNLDNDLPVDLDDQYFLPNAPVANEVFRELSPINRNAQEVWLEQYIYSN